MKHNKIEKDIVNDPPFSIDPVDFEITSNDFSSFKYEFTNYLADKDIDDDDRKYVENYLSIIKEISNQYEAKYFEENGVHTEGYWFNYLRELITEE